MRLFTDILRDLDIGQAVDDLTTELNDLVAKVLETGKNGTLTLKLQIKAPARRDHNAVEVVYDVTTKAPKLPAASTVLFATPEGDLVREDPRQASLPGIREVVDRKTGEIKEAV